MTPSLKIRTKQECDALLTLLGEISQKIFSEKSHDLSIKEEEWGKHPWFEGIKGFLNDIKKEGLAYNEQCQKIKNLSEELSHLEVVKMSLPFNPSEKFIANIYDILSDLDPTGLVVDFTLDKSVASGAKLFYKGKYLDLTLHSRISNLLNEENAINKYL